MACRSTLPHKRTCLSIIYGGAGEAAPAGGAVSTTAQSSPLLPPSVETRLLSRRLSDPINRLSVIAADNDDDDDDASDVLGGQSAQSSPIYQGLLPANVDENAFVCQTVTQSGARLVLPRSGRRRCVTRIHTQC